MNAITSWQAIAGSELVERIGWTLVHSTWVLTIVGAFFATCDVLVGRVLRSSQAQYAISVCGLLCMLICVPAIYVQLTPSSATSSVGTGMKLTTGPASPSNSPVVDTSSSLAIPTSVAHGTASAHENREPRLTFAASNSASAVASGEATHSESPAAISAAGRGWLAAIVSFWMLGTFLFLLRPILGLRHIRRLSKSADFAVPDWMTTSCERFVVNLRLRKTVRIALSEYIAVPAVIGIFRPLVLLPTAALNSMTTDQLNAIIAHELAHVRRRDNLVNLLQLFAEAILFFHPVMWWVSTRIRRERENCCDDIAVTLTGDRHQYLESLLAIEQFSGTIPLVASAAVRGSLLHRFQRLAAQTPNTSAPSGFGVLPLLLVCTVLGVAVSAAAIPSSAEDSFDESADSENSDAATAEKPAARQFRVQLVDTTAKPIAEKPVKVTIRWRGKNPGKLKPAEVETTTNADGFLAVKVHPPEGATGLSQVFVRGKGILTFKQFFRNADKDDFDPEPFVVSNMRSRTTRVVDPDGQPVSGAKVYVLAVPEGDYQDWFQRELKTDSDGTFRVSVPSGLDTGIMVKSDKGAMLRLVMPARTPKWPDLHLQRGAVLSGNVLDKNGKPIKGCVVHIESDDRQDVDNELQVGRYGSGKLNIEQVAVTDDNGHYEFTPLLGNFVLKLIHPDSCFEENSEQHKACVAPPPFVPQSVQLSTYGRHEKTLIAAATTTISGRMLDEHNKPISDQTLYASLPPFRGLSYTRIARTKTDVDGRYTMEVPIPLQNLYFAVSSSGNHWVTSTHSESQRRKDSISLENVSGEITVDWKRFPNSEKPEYAKTTPSPRDRPSKDADVAAVEEMILGARDAYKQATSEAETPEQKQLAEQLDPRPVLCPVLLKYEEEHRGTPAALSAIHYILRAAETTTSRTPYKAREQIVDVLHDHYLDHFDLDMFLHGFTSGRAPGNARKLLRAAIEDSPHPHVRALAMYEMATLLFEQNRISEWADGAIESYERMIPNQTPATAKWMQEQIDQWKDTKKILAKSNVDDREAEALELLDVLMTRYRDVHAPRRWFDGRARVELQLHAEEDPWLKHWNAAAKAQFLKFQRTRLILNQKAPELEGPNLYHQRIRLSDFRGKVVVLTVTDGTVNEEEMYNRCAELLDEFEGKPFAVLSVIPTDASGGYSVRDIVRECKITWPIVRDTHGDALSRHWCQQTTPESYVIDEKGTLVHHESGYECVSASTKQTVDRLLADLQE